MSNESDDLQKQTIALKKSRRSHDSRRGPLNQIPELIADVYNTAASPVRAGLIERLLEPVGPLGLVAIAGGAFGGLLHRGSYKRLVVSLDDVARISSNQMLELARYVEQCNPHTLQQIASLLAANSAETAGLVWVRTPDCAASMAKARFEP